MLNPRRFRPGNPRICRDLGRHLRADRTDLLPREDGRCLRSRGLVHSFHGESESGKSMFAQIESARILRNDGRVLYVDFESDASAVVGRLLLMGCAAAQIKTGMRYVQPDKRPSAESEAPAYLALLAQTFDLAVIDGVTEGMGVFGVDSSMDNDKVALWVRTFPRRVAQHTGAATVLIDHVTKNSDSRGRFAIGAQAKPPVSMARRTRSRSVSPWDAAWRVRCLSGWRRTDRAPCDPTAGRTGLLTEPRKRRTWSWTRRLPMVISGPDPWSAPGDPMSN